MSQKRTTKRGNYRSVSHLCPNCFSTLSQTPQGSMICTGDRLDQWREEYQKLMKLSSDQINAFLNNLDNPSRFKELGSTVPGQPCGNSSKLSHVAPLNSVRIPDPMAVTRLERKLQRRLSEEELDEDYVFEDGYTLPFVNFPEDV